MLNSVPIALPHAIVMNPLLDRKPLQIQHLLHVLFVVGKVKSVRHSTVVT